MPLDKTLPFTSNFSDCFQVQAAGIADTGANYPSGIAGNLDIVSDPLGIKGNVMRATVNSTDVLTSSGQRAEIRSENHYRAEWWYTWEFMLPSSWPTDKRFTIMQIHESPDSGDPSTAPMFMLVAQYDELAAYAPDVVLPGTSIATKILGTAPLIKDHWYTACFHARWTIDNTGFRELFIDSNAVFREYEVGTCYDDVQGPYFKLGIYDYQHQTGWTSRTAYYSNAKIYSGNDGYSAIMGLPVPRNSILVLP